jgi:hypothetical protein
MKQSYNIYKIEQLPKPKQQNYLFDENNNYIVDKNKLPVGKSGSFTTLMDEEVEAIHKHAGWSRLSHLPNVCVASCRNTAGGVGRWHSAAARGTGWCGMQAGYT